MEHLDANDFQDLMSGMLTASARERVLAHLDTCDDCREVLAITASDVARQSLPRFHEDDVSFAATSAPGERPRLSMTQTSDPAIDLGAEATALPQDLLATP